MIGFFIGLFVGGFFGVAIMCCLNVASEADDQMEREQEKICCTESELVEDDRMNETDERKENDSEKE
jgi:hypothetical protein